MATVTAYSAAKTIELLGANIVNATLVGDDLILHKRDGTTVNVGDVRGPGGAAASEEDIDAAVAAAMAAIPQGILGLDTYGVNQNITATGGTWYNISGLEITETIVDGRVYDIAYSATITSTAALLGIDLELRVGGTFSGGVPLTRDTKFVYDANKGLGFGNSRKIAGTPSFNGAKTFLVGARVSDNATLSVRNDPSDGGNNSYLSITDLGTL